MSSLRKNYILSLLTQTLTVIAPLLVTPFVARRLQADNIGIFSYTESIVFIFGLFALSGSKTHGKREIAYCQGNTEKELQTFAEIFITSGITTAIVTLSYIIFIAMQSSYRLIFYIQVFELIAFHWDITWYYEGKENFKTLLHRNMLVKILYIILVFSLIRDTGDLLLYVILRVGTFLLGNITLLFPVISRCLKSKIRIKLSMIPVHLKKMFPLFVPQIAIQVYTVLDKTMIGVITQSPYQNGCYEEAMKVIRVLMNFVGAASGVLMPRFAALYASNRHEEIRHKLFSGIRFIFIVTLPMIAGIVIVAPVLLPLFLGEGFDDAVILLQILAVLLLLIGLSGLFGNGVLLACREEKKYTYCIVFGAIVNFLLNLFLIPILQAKGAAIASVAAELTVTATMFFCIRDKFSGRDLLTGSVKPLSATLAMTGVLLLIGKLFTARTPLYLFLITASGMFVYAAMLVLLREKLTFDIITSLKAKLLKHKERENVDGK